MTELIEAGDRTEALGTAKQADHTHSYQESVQQLAAVDAGDARGSKAAFDKVAAQFERDWTLTQDDADVNALSERLLQRLGCRKDQFIPQLTTEQRDYLLQFVFDTMAGYDAVCGRCHAVVLNPDRLFWMQEAASVDVYRYLHDDCGLGEAPAEYWAARVSNAWWGDEVENIGEATGSRTIRERVVWEQQHRRDSRLEMS